MKELNRTNEKEREFNRFIISEYLRLGSVDEVFRVHDYKLPISYPGVHRLINKWGIVKAAGPNTKMAECLAFFARLGEEKIPLERLYKRMPPSFQPSLPTLYRIYGNVKREVKKNIEERTLRRVGTAVVVVSNEKDNLVLTGKDVSTPRLNLGKPFRSISLPMGFSKKGEGTRDSILRVLQQEVFTQNVIDRNFPYRLIPKDNEPFMYLDIADVRVSVYRIKLSKELSSIKSFSSYKLSEYKYIDAVKLKSENCFGGRLRIRTGVVDIAKGYCEYKDKKVESRSFKPFYRNSELNAGIAALTFDFA